jgi:hypothetical protein
MDTRSIWNLRPQDTNHLDRLLEDAHSKPPVPASLDSKKLVVTAEERLQHLHEASTNLLAKFSEVDASKDDYLGRSELERYSSTQSGLSSLLHHYSRITDLHDENPVQTLVDSLPSPSRRSSYRAVRYRYDYGMSQSDLESFKLLTSSNPDDRSTFISRSTWNHATPGLIGGGLVAGVGTFLLTQGMRRAGLAGVGLGLAVGAASWGISRWNAGNDYESKRLDLSTNMSVDAEILRRR